MVKLGPTTPEEVAAQRAEVELSNKARSEREKSFWIDLIAALVISPIMIVVIAALFAVCTKALKILWAWV